MGVKFTIFKKRGDYSGHVHQETVNPEVFLRILLTIWLSQIHYIRKYNKFSCHIQRKHFEIYTIFCGNH